jgi:glycosyltransferase involved in cell wall biosynthesis
MLNSIGPHLRIAQVAPLYESVPPKFYGGTERVVAYLTRELLRRGHDVTLFASGDSTAAPTIKSPCPSGLRVAGLVHLGASLQLPMLSELFDAAEHFDIIHNHLDYWAFPFARLVPTPVLSTLHGRLDVKELFPIYRYYADVPLISISDAQRAPLPEMNWISTVHHGLPDNGLKFNRGPGKYLAFLGRIAPEKRPDLAIEIARRSGIPMKIAAKVDAVDRAYFESVVRPLLDGRHTEFIGEISEHEKSEFLGQAIALLFPIDWPEPFGLVVIEALACGTPVIARPCGSVPELIRSGVTGFVASSIDELTDAVRRLASISRHACRAEFETRFSAGVMASNYEEVYYRLIRESRARARPNGRSAREVSGGIDGVESTQPWRPDIETT